MIVAARLEHPNERRGIVIDHKGQGDEPARIALRQVDVHGDGDDGRVLGARRRLERQEAGPVLKSRAVKNLLREIGPGVGLSIGEGSLSSEAERKRPPSRGEEKSQLALRASTAPSKLHDRSIIIMVLRRQARNIESRLHPCGPAGRCARPSRAPPCSRGIDWATGTRNLTLELRHAAVTAKVPDCSRGAVRRRSASVGACSRPG